MVGKRTTAARGRPFCDGGGDGNRRPPSVASSQIDRPHGGYDEGPLAGAFVVSMVAGTGFEPVTFGL